MLNETIVTSPAPSMPAVLRYIQTGDNLGTVNHQLQATDVAQGLGHLKATKADAAAPAFTGSATAVNLSVSGTLTLNNASGQVQLASRSVTRHQALAGNSTDWIASGSPRGSWAQVSTGSTLFLHLDRLPDGQTLTSVTVRVSPALTHGGFSLTLPSISLWRINDDATSTQIGGTVTDSSAALINYETVHDITISSLSHVVDLDLYRYVVQVSGEAGGDFESGLTVVKCKVTCTVTYYPEY